MSLKDRFRNRPQGEELNVLAIRIMFWIAFAGVLYVAWLQVLPILRAVARVATPFILGLILAYVFHPVVRWFETRYRIGRLMGVTTVATILFLGAVTFLAILAPIFYVQIGAAVDGTKDYFHRLKTRDLWNELPEGLRKQAEKFVEREGVGRDVFGMIRGDDADTTETATPAEPVAEVAASAEPPGPSATPPPRPTPADASPKPSAEAAAPERGGAIERALEGGARFIGPLAEWAGRTFSAAFSVFGRLGAMAMTAVLTVISTFYFLLEMSKIPGVIRRLLPAENGERVWDILLKIDKGVGGFIRGQAMSCIGVGILVTTVLLVIGPRKYALLIGFAAGSTNFIPYLGPVIGALPAVLWALFTGSLDGWGERGIQLALTALGFWFVQAVDGFVFQPFIVGKSASLHPLAVMLALVVGAQFGLGGMLLAVPAACAVKVLFVELYWNKRRDFLAGEGAGEGGATPDASPEESPPA